EKRADTPYRFEPRLERAAVASLAVVEATREGTARARTVGVNRACALGPQRRQRRTRLLERVPSLEHVGGILSRAGKLIGLEGDAPEQGPVATESTRPTEGPELGFGSAAHGPREAVGCGFGLEETRHMHESRRDGSGTRTSSAASAAGCLATSAR